MQSIRTGGCIEQNGNGSKIPMHLKNGVCSIKLCVKGEKHDKTMNQKSAELGPLSASNRHARL